MRRQLLIRYLIFTQPVFLGNLLSVKLYWGRPMIESQYWKEYLSRVASELRARKKPAPITVRRGELIKRDVIIALFIMRRLIELSRVPRRVANSSVQVSLLPTRKLVTKVRYIDIDENYDWTAEKVVRISVLELCNLFIHSYAVTLVRDTGRNWVEIIVTSDRKRLSGAYRVSVHLLRSLLKAFAEERVESIHYARDQNRSDYRVRAE